MKLRLSVYLDPGLMQQLTELADRKEQPKSLVAEAAIASFLTPDEGDRREAAFSRRLDLLTRQIDRLERDHMISAEALALFVRFWLTVTSSLFVMKGGQVFRDDFTGSGTNIGRR
jgi:hypothetical protein